MNRNPSEELQKILNDLEAKAVENISFGNLEESFRYYNQMLNEIFKSQEQEKKSIHKGLPLHMMGVILLFQKKDNESLMYHLLAYVEDTLTAPEGQEKNADTAPAYKNLVNVFTFDLEILEKIKKISQFKKSKKIDVSDPENILFELKLEEDNLLQYKIKLPGFLEKRVFIGGDYLINSENITILEKYVGILNFNPIIPHYIRPPGLPPNYEYDFSIHCLKNCKQAIFTVVHGGGHFFEIQKCIDFKIQPLLIVHKFRDEKKKRDKLSGMVTSMGLSIIEYSDPFEELKKIVKDYLI